MFNQGKCFLTSSLSIEDFFLVFIRRILRACARENLKDLILFSFTHSHLAELVVNKFPAVLILRTCLLTFIEKIEGLWTGHPLSGFLWFLKGRRIFRYLLGLSYDPFTALTHCLSHLGNILSPGHLDECMSLTCDCCYLLLTAVYVFLFHLRFDYNQIFGGKISKHVEYSEFLNLRPYMTSPVRKRMCHWTQNTRICLSLWPTKYSIDWENWFWYFG